MAGVGAWVVLSGGAFGFLGTGGDGGDDAGGSVFMGSFAWKWNLVKVEVMDLVLVLVMVLMQYW